MSFFKKLSKIKFKTYLMMVVAGIVPLLTKLYMRTECMYSEYSWYGMADSYSDVSCMLKVYVFSAIAIIMALSLTNSLFSMKGAGIKEYFKRFWPAFVIIVLTILSTIYAINRDIALYGEFEQFEPMLVLIGYPLVLMYAYLNIKDDTDIRLISYAFLFGSMVESVLGIAEIFGYRLIAMPFLQWLLVERTPYLNGVCIANSDSTGAVSVVSTLGNPNYAGVYAGMMIPFILSLAFYFKDKKFKIIAGIDTLLLLIFLYGTGSDAAELSILAAAVILVIFLFNFLKKYKKLFIGGAVVAAIGILVLGITTKFRFVKSTVNALFPTKASYDLTGIDTNSDYIELDYKGKVIKINFELFDSGFVCGATEDDKDLEFYIGSGLVGTLTLTSGEEIPIEFYYDENMNLLMTANISDTVFTFCYTRETGDYLFINYAGDYVESTAIETPIYGYGALISHRGYIWGLSMMILHKYILIGAGPDNFPLAVFYDGIDYADWYFDGNPSILFLRPHSYYLQMWINTGFLSFAMYMVLFVRYIIDCFKLYFLKKKTTGHFSIGMGLFLSVVVFLICSISNDSRVGTAPVFYLLLGMGMVINNIVRKEEGLPNCFPKEKKHSK